MKLEDSVGRISKNTVTVYPPGVPVVITGAEITKEIVYYLKSCGGEIIGLNDEFIEVKKEGF